jgi:hypothetical protein
MSLDSAVEDVVVAGGGDVGDDHAVFDALLEVDVLVERDVGPVVDQLDDWRSGSRSGPSRPNRWMMRTGVPVDVVVDQEVAVLEVLALRDAVGADEDIDLGGLVREG